MVTVLGSNASIPASVPSFTSTVLAETDEIPRPRVKTIANNPAKIERNIIKIYFIYILQGFGSLTVRILIVITAW